MELSLFSLGLLVESAVRVHVQVLVVLHHLHDPSRDAQGLCDRPGLPELRVGLKV